MAALIEKALEFREKAKGHEKPKLTWWKPKYRKAADDYCRAAQFHYQAGKEDDAQTDLLCACECYKKKRAWFSAAKALEQVITICLKKKPNENETSAVIALTTNVTDQIPKTVAYKDQVGLKGPLLKERQNIKQWTFQAAGLHRKAGQPDACASLLEKVGRSLESIDPECTVLMLEMAAETVETENRPFQAACYTSRLLRIALEKNNLPRAVERARKLVSLYQESGHKLNSGKYSLMLFLLLLADKRDREAIAVAREYGNYCTKEQNKVIDELLQGTQNKDEDAGKLQIHKALQDKTLSDLDSSIKPVIENLIPENTNTEQESVVLSSDHSISGSMVEHDIDDHVIEGENVAEAFSVLSRYFQTLSNNFQGGSIEEIGSKPAALDLILPKNMSTKRKDSNTSSQKVEVYGGTKSSPLISKSSIIGEKSLIKRDSNSDVRKMWFLDDNVKTDSNIVENKEILENQDAHERGKKSASSVIPSITLELASMPINKCGNSKEISSKNKKDRSRSPSKFIKGKSTDQMPRSDEPRKKRDSFQRTNTIHVDSRAYSKSLRKAGRETEDTSAAKYENAVNAMPVVVGAASVGVGTAAMLGLEMSKARAHEKTGQNYLISEMYEDDNMDDFGCDYGAMEAD